MAASREELIAEAMEAQQLVARSMLSLAEPNWLELDLTLTQLKSLMVLTASGSMPIHRLADLLHIQRSAASTLGNHLVRVHLLTRAEDPDDRRQTLLDLAPGAQPLATRLRQGHEKQLAATLGK